MFANRVPAGARAARVSKALRFAVVLVATGLATYWGGEIAAGVPDAYPGEHYSGFLLSLGMLLGNVGVATDSRRVDLVLLVLSALAVAGALYFMSAH
jgi:hypothetical protein